MDTPREVNYLNGVDVVAAEMDQEVAQKFYHLMHDLNKLYYQIIKYIMGTYEREYLMERMQRFPLPIDEVEYGIEKDPKGKVVHIAYFRTNGQSVWDLLQTYTKDQEAMLNQIRDLIMGGVNGNEIIQLNITNELLKTATSRIAELEKLVANGADLAGIVVEHKIPITKIKEGNLLYLDWLFPNRKVKVKHTISQRGWEGFSCY